MLGLHSPLRKTAKVRVDPFQHMMQSPQIKVNRKITLNEVSDSTTEKTTLAKLFSNIPKVEAQKPPQLRIPLTARPAYTLRVQDLPMRSNSARNEPDKTNTALADQLRATKISHIKVTANPQSIKPESKPLTPVVRLPSLAHLEEKSIMITFGEDSTAKSSSEPRLEDSVQLNSRDRRLPAESAIFECAPTPPPRRNIKVAFQFDKEGIFRKPYLMNDRVFKVTTTSTRDEKVGGASRSVQQSLRDTNSKNCFFDRANCFSFTDFCEREQVTERDLGESQQSSPPKSFRLRSVTTKAKSKQVMSSTPSSIPIVIPDQITFDGRDS